MSSLQFSYSLPHHEHLHDTISKLSLPPEKILLTPLAPSDYGPSTSHLRPSRLSPLRKRIALRPEFIANKPTTVTVTQDQIGNPINQIAVDETGNVILSAKGKWQSGAGRKQFLDASGLPLYELRTSWYSMSKAWRLELPGDGQVVMTIRMKTGLANLEFDCTFKNKSPGEEGKEVTLELRTQDNHYMVTHVNHGESRVATIRRRGWKMGTMFADFHSLEPNFDVDVAEGMDKGLACVMAIVMGNFVPPERDAAYIRPKKGSS